MHKFRLFKHLNSIYSCTICTIGYIMVSVGKSFWFCMNLIMFIIFFPCFNNSKLCRADNVSLLRRGVGSPI